MTEVTAGEAADAAVALRDLITDVLNSGILEVGAAVPKFVDQVTYFYDEVDRIVARCAKPKTSASRSWHPGEMRFVAALRLMMRAFGTDDREAQQMREPAVLAAVLGASPPVAAHPDSVLFEREVLLEVLVAQRSSPTVLFPRIDRWFREVENWLDGRSDCSAWEDLLEQCPTASDDAVAVHEVYHAEEVHDCGAEEAVDKDAFVEGLVAMSSTDYPGIPDMVHPDTGEPCGLPLIEAIEHLVCRGTAWVTRWTIQNIVYRQVSACVRAGSHPAIGDALGDAARAQKVDVGVVIATVKKRKRGTPAALHHLDQVHFGREPRNLAEAAVVVAAAIQANTNCVQVCRVARALNVKLGLNIPDLGKFVHDACRIARKSKKNVAKTERPFGLKKSRVFSVGLWRMIVAAHVSNAPALLAVFQSSGYAGAVVRLAADGAAMFSSADALAARVAAQHGAEAAYFQVGRGPFGALGVSAHDVRRATRRQHGMDPMQQMALDVHSALEGVAGRPKWTAILNVLDMRFAQASAVALAVVRDRRPGGADGPYGPPTPEIALDALEKAERILCATGVQLTAPADWGYDMLLADGDESYGEGSRCKAGSFYDLWSSRVAAYVQAGYADGEGHAEQERVRRSLWCLVERVANQPLRNGGALTRQLCGYLGHGTAPPTSLNVQSVVKENHRQLVAWRRVRDVWAAGGSLQQVMDTVVPIANEHSWDANGAAFAAWCLRDMVSAPTQKALEAVTAAPRND